MTSIIVRIDLGEGGRIGPGKILLLEMIRQHGSISAAGRAMGLPYRHAWELVEQLNSTFLEPVVACQTGGRRGGGAALTEFGSKLLERLIALRRDAERAADRHLAAIAGSLKDADHERASRASQAAASKGG